METVQEYLQKNQADGQLVSVLMTILLGVKQISVAVRTADTGRAGSKNIFGEEQLAIDVLSDRILQEEFKNNSLVGLIASEELPAEMKLGAGEFAVAYDPLDGSSLVDVNLAVGSIFGVYRATTFVGVRGDEQVASMMAVYGPRTTLILTVRRGVAAFVLNENGEFVLFKENILVGEGKMFAPGNLRACVSRPGYMELMNFWCKNAYTLRYSGGMVPDINHILLKGKGIFSYPGYDQEPNGKLRLLFECAPMSLLMEQAGGASSDGKVRILAKPVESLEQRTPIFIGSKLEVQRCEKMLG